MAEITKAARRYFLTGLLTVFPLVITLYLFRILFSFVGTLSSPFLTPVYERFLSEKYSLFFMDLASFLLTLVLITILGFVVNNLFLSKRIIESFENLLERIPFVSGVYITIKKLTDFFSPISQKKFQKVVLVRFPSKSGSYAVGLVTGEGAVEARYLTKEALTNVFVPTSPNPTSGYLLFVPQEELISLSMSVDDAMKMIISGGIAVPHFDPEKH